MDPQADSDEEFIVVSTPDCTESASYPGAPFPGLKSSAELFVKSIGFLPSLLGVRVTEFQGSGTSRTHIRKYSETIKRQIVDQHSITNYNCVINGGRGGSGGKGSDQGGHGGAGHGPTVYFGESQEREPSEFRTIPRGDMKLVKEVRLSPQSGVVGRQSRGVSVRRAVYHAKIRGDPGTVTVAVYQGNGAEEEWRKDVAKYKSIWDPHIMQPYGLVSTNGLYAMVFHDELIPYRQFCRRFENSPILTVYIAGYCPIGKNTEFEEATNYISGGFRKSSEYGDLSAWIRPSTGELCLDLVQGGPEPISELPWWVDADVVHVLRLENVSLDAPDLEDMIISSLSEDQYHELCSQPSIARHRYFQISTKYPVGPGIFRLDSQDGTCVWITEPLQILPDKEFDWDNHGHAPDELLPNSWIRYDSRQTYALGLHSLCLFSSYKPRKAWLAQATHIFVELDEVAHVEDYVCVFRVEFILQIPYKPDIPEGYLFVCPPQDFHTGTEPHSNLYQWPACPAYWSLDPSGADCLSTEDAKNLGFPAIHIETKMYGDSWDRSVYEGLRRFHKGKGFDPDSREVARQLGYLLYKVLGDLGSEVPFPAREVGLFSPHAPSYPNSQRPIPSNHASRPTRTPRAAAAAGAGAAADRARPRQARNRRAGSESSLPQTRLCASGCSTPDEPIPTPSTTTRPRPNAYESRRFPSTASPPQRAAHPHPPYARAVLLLPKRLLLNELVMAQVAADADGAHAPRAGCPNGASSLRRIFSASFVKCGGRAAVRAVVVEIVRMYVADGVPLLGEDERKHASVLLLPISLLFPATA
ncbi:hypothetical protein MSAN_01508300 [Mycena sanguinolenta]|uniref:Uncharacterized protein n=1 Tax=Mycena sanguinolenta TaxID=230812 RepID=A0A8H6Y6R5_9AGAR|nr:hypothetical protein MSAN_01508300 [Mycena sanguinolenta]